jgi:hypothetical protein
MHMKRPITAELHSKKSGSSPASQSAASDFSDFVERLYGTVRGQRKMVQLVEMQAALIERGWHP